MGFPSRLLVPRRGRRAMHPVRAAERAVTPKVVKQAGRALHPVDNAIYGAERQVITSLRPGRKAKAPRKGRRRRTSDCNGSDLPSATRLESHRKVPRLPPTQVAG